VVEGRAPPWNGINVIEQLTATTGDEQENSNEVGMILHSVTIKRSLLYMNGRINNRTCRLLLDSGASSNFVSSEWVKKYKQSTSQLNQHQEVKMANGVLAVAKERLERAALHIGEYHGPVSFIVLDLPQVDAILGIPWLREVNPTINWITSRILTTDGTIIYRGQSATQMLKEKQQKKTSREAMSLHYAAFDQTLNQCGKGTAASADSINKMKALLSSYSDLFPEELPRGLPPQRRLDHRIILYPGTKPIHRKQYRIPIHYIPEFKRQIQQQLAAGRIRPSTSPYSAPVLLVMRNNKLRMCLDLRGLNAATVKDQTSLPNQHELFDVLQGNKWFSKLDLRSGFNQMRISPKDIEKTAFNTPWGHFECTAMPFGLTNAPASFQALMQEVLRERLYEGVVVFVDDFLIYSKTEEEHLEMVEWVFQQLRKHQLYGAIDKCSFMKNEVDILGHTINADGIKTQVSKVEAIQQWPVPVNLKQMRSFLGLANYYRNFVAGFSRIAAPLHALVQKKKQWTWGEVEQKAFNELKLALTNTPTLSLPDPNLPFIITTDASQFAIGAVLSQQKENGLQPVAYMSQKMNSAERNYPTHEQELLAVVRALQDWRYYLLGSPHTTTIYTDHDSLKYLYTQPHLSKRQLRWLEQLQDYKLDITHQSGTKNVVADALSRRSDHETDSASTSPILVTSQTLSATETSVKAVQLNTIGITSVSAESLLDEIRTATAAEQECQAMAADLQQYGLASYMDGLLYKHPGCIYVPNNRELRSKILHEVHTAPTGGHLGVAKTIDRLSRHFYWVDQKHEVQQFIQSCVQCASNKSSNQAPAGLLQPLEVPQKRWEHVSLDFIGPLPLTLQTQYDMIFVVVDKFSKMVHLLPCKSTITAAQTAQLFFREVVRHHGIPSAIISDRDPRFTSKFWKELWKLLGTQLKMSTAYHPQTDGQTERTNRTVEEMLRSFVNANANDWDRHLTAVEIALNSSKQSSTNHTPYQLNYGQDINLPLDIASKSATHSAVPGSVEFIQQWHRDMESARENIKKAQDRQKQQTDKHRREVWYKIGDRVMLNNNDWLKTGRKLLPKYWGPFRVTAVPSAVTVKLELPQSLSRIHDVVHISKVKPYRESELEFPDRQQLNRPPPLIADDNQWEVESVIGKRDRYVSAGRGKRRRKVTEYLVVWKGYPMEEASWTVPQDIHPELITEYERRANNADADDGDSHSVDSVSDNIRARK
jgi:hypothetical protein